MKFLLIAVLCLGGIGCVPVRAALIRPGAPWRDDRGLPIQAHGGGIIRVGDIYYWFGEDRGRNNLSERRYVGCYSSRNLVDWKFCRQVVALTDPEKLGRGWILERPKVFYNAPTKKYVMYAHLDDRRYQLARVAVLTSDTVDGEYHYLKSFRPLGEQSRDIGQFIDDDGSAYLIFEDRPHGFHIARLSSDYLSVERDVCLIPEALEGGALVHYQGLYYAIGSKLTGWSPNPNKYATATSLGGPWSTFRDMAPPETNTYGSQSTMMVKVVGTHGTTVIFMGDIWRPATQWDSRYLWMPLTIGCGQLYLLAPRPWKLNIHTGETRLNF